MADPTPVFVYAIASLSLVTVLALLWWAYGKRWRVRVRSLFEDSRAEENRIARAREQTRRQLLDAGMHIEKPDGAIVAKCRVESCMREATVARFRFGRDERLRDLVRRLAGAPGRFSVEKTDAALDWCDTCAPTAAELCRGEALVIETERNALMLKAELKLGHFERVGIYGKMNELAEQAELADPYRQKRRAPAKVVSLTRAAR